MVFSLFFPPSFGRGKGWRVGWEGEDMMRGNRGLVFLFFFFCTVQLGNENLYADPPANPTKKGLSRNYADSILPSHLVTCFSFGMTPD